MLDCDAAWWKQRKPFCRHTSNNQTPNPNQIFSYKNEKTKAEEKLQLGKEESQAAVAPPASLLENVTVVEDASIPSGVNKAKWQQLMALRQRREVIVQKDKRKEAARVDRLKKRIVKKGERVSKFLYERI